MSPGNRGIEPSLHSVFKGSMSLRTFRVLLLVIGAVTIPACQAGLGTRHQSGITDEQLLADDEFPRPTSDQPKSAEAVFAVSPEMSLFLEREVSGSTTERTFDDLIDAMDAFGIRYLEYDNRTLTASEAFEQRRGNCLTFTNMFLVMAREVGLKAQFQEVRIPPDWIRQGNTMVLRRHVNVRVHLAGRAVEGMDRRVVDFGDESTPANYIDTANNVISDRRALAHFYNNWAAETLESGNDALAFDYLRKALLEGDPEFSPAWNLAGVMYQRAGREDRAEQAFLRALLAEPDEISAMSNLQRLYSRQGRKQLSRHYEQKVTKHRKRNPYLLLADARKAYGEGDYKLATDLLRKAIRLRPDESDLYYLLADVYRAKGDQDRATRYEAEGRKLADAANRLRGSGDPDQRQALVKPKVPRS